MPYSYLKTGAAGLFCIGLAGCSWFGLDSQSDKTAQMSGSGFVVGDEPLAVQAGASILKQGGSAADAATAIYFSLAATYPVAAGLGGGGVCVVRDPGSSRAESINFLSRDSAAAGAFGVPGNVRGFAVLQAAYGRLSWQRDVASGEGFAASGFPISQALEVRLRSAQNAIRLDANLAAEFLDESGVVKPVGTVVSNADLSATLSAIRIYGPNTLYTGGIAQKLVDYSLSQGGAIKLDELAGYPVVRDLPGQVRVGDELVYLPPSKVGAGAYEVALLGRVVDPQGQISAANPAAAIAQATKATLDQFGISTLPRDLGATGFAAVDGSGEAVACAVTLNGPFGSGHTATSSGVIFSRAPASAQGGYSGAFLTPIIATLGGAGSPVLVGAGAGGPNGTAAITYALLRLALNQDVMLPGEIHSTGIAPFDTVNLIACQSGRCVAIPDPAANGLGAEAAP
jgi:gamma-glutamyltranspeptidase / glutathione hydrolase